MPDGIRKATMLKKMKNKRQKNQGLIVTFVIK